VNHARWDLCGGCSAMGIPTAIASELAVNKREIESWARSLKSRILKNFKIN
jgi:hypothetical protein